MQSGGRQQKGPETDPKDRGRQKRLQRQVCDIVGSDTYWDNLVEATTNEKSMASLKANPRAYLKSKGVAISDELDVEITEESPLCVTICYSWWIFRACCRACI